jgi:hypothetical protein
MGRVLLGILAKIPFVRSFAGTVLLVAAICTVGLGACGSSTNGDPPAPLFDAGALVDHHVSPDVSLVERDGAADVLECGPENIAPAEASNDEGDAPLCLTCAAYGVATAVGPVPAQLPELSGLAASRRHPGILYAHNDSGDTARFFALNERAELQAEMDVPGAVATDWEDIAVGPCPIGSCVYVGDIGDNNARRTEYVIYRIAEPETLPSDGSAFNTPAERFPFVYPDGPHNAETLLVHPSTGRIFVVTKVAGVTATVYELPLPLTPDVTATLVLVTPVSLPASAGLITGGSFHPCADRLLLRTYGSPYEFSLRAGAALEAIFTADPVAVPAALEIQGEAVTYSFDGNSYFTSSETVAGTPPAVLSVVSCP